MTPDSHPTITFNTLLQKWNENPNFFNGLPEYCFVVPLAEKIKEKNCTCGMGQELAAARAAFNLISTSLSEEAVSRMKALFNVEKLCFGLESQDGFDVRCY